MVQLTASLSTGSNATERPWWREEHDRLLLGAPHHPCIKNESLLDDTYLVETENPHDRRKTVVPIRFDAVVAPGAGRLNTEEHIHDCITAKLYVVFGLSHGIGWSTSASSMAQSYRSLLSMVRWRDENGIKRMSSLTQPWFEKFYDDLRRAGLEGLVPVGRRVDELLAEIEEGLRPWPQHRPASWRARLSWEQIAHQVGLADPAALPRHVRERVLTSLQWNNPELYEATISTSGRKERLTDDDSKGNAKLTHSRLEVLLQPWDNLWSLRDRMAHDPLTYRAFDHTRSRRSFAVALGREVGRTPDPPPYQTCFLVDRAIRWVLEYSHDIRRCVKLVQEICRKHPPQEGPGRNSVRSRAIGKALTADECACVPTDAPGAPWPIAPAYQKHPTDGTLDLRTAALVLLPAACFIVVAVFSARRGSEIESLKADCIESDEYGLWLHVWIEKTLRRLDRIPIPPSVGKAVEVLQWLSEEARASGKESWLFSFQEATGTRNIDFYPHDAIRVFAAFVGVPPLADGSSWLFSPHQFRKFFALVYFYRFRFASLTALSDFLKHFNPDETRRYVTNLIRGYFLRYIEERDASDELVAAAKKADQDAINRAEEFEQGRRNFIIDVFRSVALGREHAGGFGGKALTADLEGLAEEAKRLISISSTTTGPEGELDRLLVAFIDGRSLEPHPDGHSYCLCRDDTQDLAIAECLKAKREAEGPQATSGATGPDLTYATDLTCASCPHNMQSAENEAYWVDAVAEAEDVAAKGISPHQREVAADRAQKLKDHHCRWFSNQTSEREAASRVRQRRPRNGTQK